MSEAIMQQHYARYCHDRAVDLLSRGCLCSAASWQRQAAWHSAFALKLLLG
jgi:hypothetical protein